MNGLSPVVAPTPALLGNSLSAYPAVQGSNLSAYPAQQQQQQQQQRSGITSSSSYPNPYPLLPHSTSTSYPYPPSYSSAASSTASPESAHQGSQGYYGVQTHGLQTPPQSPLIQSIYTNNNGNGNYQPPRSTPPPYNFELHPVEGMNSIKSHEKNTPDTPQFETQSMLSSQRLNSKTENNTQGQGRNRSNSSKITMPAIPASFPQLKGLSAAGLERLLKDDIALEVYNISSHFNF